MSRYMVNKLMWEVDSSNEALDEFKSDCVGFIERWQRITPDPPHPRGGRLTGEERHALERKDWGYLYAMGVNPFLLWQFARSVSVPDEMSVERLIETFRDSVAPHGYPDFST